MKSTGCYHDTLIVEFISLTTITQKTQLFSPLHIIIRTDIHITWLIRDWNGWWGHWSFCPNARYTVLKIPAYCKGHSLYFNHSIKEVQEKTTDTSSKPLFNPFWLTLTLTATPHLVPKLACQHLDCHVTIIQWLVDARRVNGRGRRKRRKRGRGRQLGVATLLTN